MTSTSACRTGKAQFATRAQAERRLQEIQQSPDPTRLYHPTSVAPLCSSCGQYHLTSNSRKRYAKGKRRR